NERQVDSRGRGAMAADEACASNCLVGITRRDVRKTWEAESMKRSTDRILTTHMGSLPRPDVLADLLVAQAEGRSVDAARIPLLTDEAMDHIVRRQLDCG